jgi:uroporphyrinogen decarboxylase
MNERENWLRAVDFRYPQWIPCGLGFSPVTWHAYRDDLERLVLAHPRIFPRHDQAKTDFYDHMPVVYREGEYYRDNWGCLWRNIQGGLEGQVVEHPLADWRNLAAYRLPDPLTQEERGERDWSEIERDIAEQKEKGYLIWGNGERLFDRLYFLRGFDNLMLDFAEEPRELSQLIALLEDYELRLIRRWLQIGVDVIGFHTDIGAQASLMISPASFRKYIKPMFQRLFQTCRQAGVHAYLSSDGHVLEIVDDLVECGVSVHDPQLRANTLEGIALAYKGKLCANVDLDRQSFPFITPAQIRQQVKEVVDRMARPEGGLMIGTGIFGADVPLRNIEAICVAMEDFCFP